MAKGIVAHDDIITTKIILYTDYFNIFIHNEWRGVADCFCNS